MNKVITVVAFLVLTATGATLFACGDSPANPPPQAPTGGGAPASSSAQPVTSPAPKGGW
ncbi:MAG TPA: hypothetical protein VIF62_21875 [Labilithrix sp.]